MKPAWLHTKTNAEVEVHVDSHVQKIKNSLAAHQQEFSYTLILIYQHLKQPSSTSKQVQELSNTLILI